MRLSEYTTAELMDAATWANYSYDERFAQYLMEEIATRVAEEHPPDGEIMESEFEEGSEEAETPYRRKFEADDDRHCVRGEN